MGDQNSVQADRVGGNEQIHCANRLAGLHWELHSLEDPGFDDIVETGLRLFGNGA